MIPFLPLARPLAALAALAAFSTAACTTGEGKPVLGEPETRAVSYEAGQRLRIDTTGDIEVRLDEGSENQGASEITVTFTPFVLVDEDATEAEKEQLRQRMGELRFVAEASEDEVVVRVDGRDFHQKLGAKVALRVPAVFSGDFVADAILGNVDVDLGGTDFDDEFKATVTKGSVRADLQGTSPASTTVSATRRSTREDSEVVVLGAAGPLEIKSDDEAEVEVTSWSNPATGSVEAGRHVTFTFPTDASCDLLVTSDSVSEPAPLPDSWTQGPDVGGAKYYVIGDGGEPLELFGNSSVDLFVR